MCSLGKGCCALSFLALERAMYVRSTSYVVPPPNASGDAVMQEALEQQGYARLCVFVKWDGENLTRGLVDFGIGCDVRGLGVLFVDDNVGRGRLETNTKHSQGTT